MEEIYHDIKSFIGRFSFLSRDVLHVYGGSLFFIFWVFILNKRRQLLCLLMIGLTAIVNEVLDILYAIQQKHDLIWGEVISDIFNTIALPIILFFFLKYLEQKQGSNSQERVNTF